MGLRGALAPYRSGAPGGPWVSTVEPHSACAVVKIYRRTVVHLHFSIMSWPYATPPRRGCNAEEHPRSIMELQNATLEDVYYKSKGRRVRASTFQKKPFWGPIFS